MEPDLAEYLASVGASAHDARDLEVWEQRLSGDGAANTIPPGWDVRCNPALAGERVVASLLKPHELRAFDRASGDMAWVAELPGYPLPSPIVAGDLVLIASRCTLFAFSLETGSLAWEFSGDADLIEYLGASPIAAGPRVFALEMDGVVHCLERDTGARLWSARPGGDRDDGRFWSMRPIQGGHDLRNVTGVVAGEYYLAANRARDWVAYHVETGREAWRRTLPETPQGELLVWGDQVAMRAEAAVYVLSISSGETLAAWHWPERLVCSATVVGDSLVALVRSLRGRQRRTDLICLRPDGEVWRQALPEGTATAVRYEPLTGLLYLSGFRGLGVIDPKTGHCIHFIQAFGLPGSSRDGVVMPGVDAEHLYVLTDERRMLALRHPTRPEAGPA